jgi:hypothetical protein
VTSSQFPPMPSCFCSRHFLDKNSSILAALVHLNNTPSGHLHKVFNELLQIAAPGTFGDVHGVVLPAVSFCLDVPSLPILRLLRRPWSLSSDCTQYLVKPVLRPCGLCDAGACVQSFLLSTFILGMLFSLTYALKGNCLCLLIIRECRYPVCNAPKS